MLRQWALPLDLNGQTVSFHVLESGDVAQALLRYAQGNHVSMIVMGAATHGLGRIGVRLQLDLDRYDLV